MLHLKHRIWDSYSGYPARHTTKNLNSTIQTLRIKGDTIHFHLLAFSYEIRVTEFFKFHLISNSKYDIICI